MPVTFQLDQSVREILKLPAYSEIAFRLDCPQMRAGQLAEELRGVDLLTDAFAASEPIGLEFEVLSGLLAICRRLGGACEWGQAVAPKTRRRRYFLPTQTRRSI
ncbi:hypothetical protein CYK25_007255 [Varibaculum cambriense]|nr:hypothetical protein CYK25_007255 [Varibaculum cambriense]